MSATLAIKNCVKCENSGITTTWSGPDDTNREYCTCYYGQQKEMFDEEEIEDVIESLINPSCVPTCYKGIYGTIHDSDCSKVEDYSNSERNTYGL